jgi:hypothetical protein
MGDHAHHSMKEIVMRNLIALTVLTVIAVSVSVAPPASAVTLAEWASSPFTIGDKLFTLISTTFEDDGKFVARSSMDVYSGSLQPRLDYVLTDETKSIVYKVTVVDDPSTPENEDVLNFIARVSATADLFIADGTFTVAGVFDDSSDFSSPLATFSNGGETWGPSDLFGFVQELYVQLTFTASGSTMLFSYTVELFQGTLPIPVESTNWSGIKDLYR